MIVSTQAEYNALAVREPVEIGPCSAEVQVRGGAVALDGSIVHAYPGSHVFARKGSSVVALPGSYVFAERWAKIAEVGGLVYHLG